MLVQAGLAGLAAVVVPTLLARQHVRALLYYTDGGERTPPPEELDVVQKLKVLFSGARLPKPRNQRDPGTLGFSYRTSMVEVEDGHLLEIWTVEGGRRQALLFHGYSRSKDQVLDALPWFHQRGFTVHLIDFRASGGSTGRRTTLGVEEARDVAAAVRWAAARGGPSLLYGFSMGGAAILGALARRDLPVEAVIVDGVYERLASTLGRRLRSVGLPPSPARELLMLLGSVELGRSAWRVAPVEDAAAVRVPALVLVGAADPRVGIDEAGAIARALPKGRLVVVDGGGHEPAFVSAPSVWEREVGAFVERIFTGVGDPAPTGGGAP